MRRTSLLCICVIAVLVAAATPASAATPIDLQTKAGGVAPAGTPVRLLFSVTAQVGGRGCEASAAGTLAINGAPKDRVTFPPVEFAAKCSPEAGLSGVVSALELGSHEGAMLKMKAKLALRLEGQCSYRVGEITTFLKLPAPVNPIIGNVSAKLRTRGKGCFPGSEEPLTVEILLDDAENGEVFEAALG